MKIRALHHSTEKKLRTHKKHGFALIATMILMMLLTIIGVGLMALAASQSRIASNTALIAEARQMALVGLDAALGEMQVQVGPDARITANSGILQSSDTAGAQFVLGVWESYDGPIYGKSKSSKASGISDTYTKGRETMFRRWMVSTNDTKEAKRMNGVEDLVSRKPGKRICLVGEGTLGTSHNSRNYIYADLLTMPSLGNKTASFAWWVGGENQKAKINIAAREESSDPVELLSRTWDTPGPLFIDSSSDVINSLGSNLDNPERILTMASIPLASNSGQEAGMSYFFDVTLNSYTLPVNVRYGGLKQDLNLLLNKQTLKDTEFKRRTSSDCPIVEQGTDVPSCSESSMPIGSWQVLHAYHNTWPDGTGRDEHYSARLSGTVTNAYTRLSGSEIRSSGQEDMNPSSGASANDFSAFSTKAMIEEGSSAAGYARHPVMLAFMSNFGLTTRMTSENKDNPEDNRYLLRLCYAPMVLWWNPYNVTMKVKGKMLWSHSVPYKTTWIQTWSNTLGYDGTPEYRWSHYAMTGGNAAAGFGNDYGEYFSNSASDERGDIVFEPGEILFFSPAKARSSDQYNEQYKNPWALGYNPSSVSGYQAHFYSNKTKREVDSGAWYLRLRFGLENVDNRNRTTDGYYFAPGRPEAMTIFNGFNGINEAATVGEAGVVAGKFGMSPQRFLLGWYDPYGTAVSTDFLNEERDSSYWLTDGSQDDGNVPYFVTSIGVTVKSANRSINAPYVTGDLRTKTWQHSNPAFFGSMVINPNEQQRQYHPYQVSAIPVGSGLSMSPMENSGKNGFLGITSDGEQVSFAATMELPLHPPFSIAGFSGMRLQPGWYKLNGVTNSSGGGFLNVLRPMQYQAGVPSVGIGNSFADPCLPADGVYTFHTNNVPEVAGGTGKIFSEFYDHGLLINDALWDRFFCSSVADRPLASGKKQAREVMSSFVKGEEPLPVARYKKTHSPYGDDAIIARVMESDGWKYIAQFLVVEGGFNINSTSIEAWTATLQGLAKRQLVSNVSSSNLSIVESGKQDSDVLFSRFAVSTTDKSIDSEGGYSPMQGSSSFRRSGNNAAWGEVRQLDSQSIRTLAEKMVEQVRKRGPFLNMSDFINRRLDGSDQELSLKGALQAAIDETDINRDFDGEQTSVASGNLYKFAKAEQGSIHTAAPGYLIQSDVLSSLGNILTLRDDTFTVRSYGCVKSASGSILAQVWCEAVVQRCIEYVDPSNAPYESEFKPDGTQGDKMTDVNRILGRKLRVVSFKWLDAWDI